MFSIAPAAVHLTLPLWITLLPVGGTHDSARLLQMLMLAVMLCWNWASARLPARPATAAVMVWALMACTCSALPTGALRECVLLMALACLAFQVGTLNGRQCLHLLRLMCCVGLLYGLIFLTTMAMALLIHGQVMPFQLVFGFDNPRHLNHTQTVLIPLALCLATTETDRRWQMVGWLGAFVASVVAAFLMGRATLLAVFVALLILAVWLRRDAVSYLKPAFRSVALGAGLGFFLLSYFGVDLPGQMVATGSWNNRLQLWRAALDDAGQSLWGVGPMHFSRVPRGDAAHPHNFYLQVAAEFGWPAAITLVIGVLWALAAMGKRVRACRSKEQQLCGAGLWVTMIAIAIDSTLSGNLVMPMSQVWVFLAIGLGLAWHRQCEGGPKLGAPSPGALACWCQVVLVGSLLVLCVVSAIEFFQVDTRLLESQWRHLPPGETLSPRFWRDGWF